MKTINFEQPKDKALELNNEIDLRRLFNEGWTAHYDGTMIAQISPRLGLIRLEGSTDFFRANWDKVIATKNK